MGLPDVPRTVIIQDDIEGVQKGTHRYVIVERYPRHVRARHHWPDGITTYGRYWLSEWRALVKRVTTT